MDDPIVQVGDPVLRRKAKAVAAKDISSKRIVGVISRMKRALAGEDFGVAIAAPQIGESLRIFVIAGRVFDLPEDAEENGAASPARPAKDAQKHPPAEDKVFINPELTRLSKKTAEMTEGCLSVRGKYGSVVRHQKATVKALNERGVPVTYHGSELVAHIFQHECDHLDGVLYIDKAVKLEEDEDMKAARAKLKEKHGI